MKLTNTRIFSSITIFLFGLVLLASMQSYSPWGEWFGMIDGLLQGLLFFILLTIIVGVLFLVIYLLSNRHKK